MSPTPEEAMRRVCAEFGTCEAALTGRSRASALVDARRAAALVLRYRCLLTFAEAGRLLGRNHADVIHLCRSGAFFYDREAGFRERVTRAAGRPLAIPKGLR